MFTAKILHQWEIVIHSKTDIKSATTSFLAVIQRVGCGCLSSNLVPRCHVHTRGGYLEVPKVVFTGAHSLVRTCSARAYN